MNLAFGFLSIDFKFDELQTVFSRLDEGNGHISYSKYFTYIRETMGSSKSTVVSETLKSSRTVVTTVSSVPAYKAVNV